MHDLQWHSWLFAAGLAIQVIAMLSAAHALSRVRTPQGTIAWCLALIAFPWVAVPFYWVFGRSKFHEYREAMRKVWMRRDGVTADFHDMQEAYRCTRLARGAELSVLNRLTGYRFTCGNTAELLVDGEETFGAMLEAIAEARQYILFQVYILRDDETGRRFQAKLIEKVRAGVRVYLLYDALGSYRLKAPYLAELEQAGVEVASFEAMRKWRYPFQLNFRNHRKILVVDGRVAFVGGLNVGNEYLGLHRRLAPWRDTHLEIRGPAVQSAQMIFVNDWHWAQREVPDNLQWEPPRVWDDGYALIMLPCGPVNPQEACTIFFVNAINMSRKRLWIATPYLVPDPSIVNALAMAVLRGVDVRILIPNVGDALVVHLASFYFLQPLTEIGVKLFRYNGFLHEKAFVVDDDMAYVGTANLDNRSFRLNFELNVLVADERFAAEVADMLRGDFARSQPTGPEDLRRKWFGFRLGVAAARLFEPIL